MRYQSILVAALCMFGFAKSSDCNERFNQKDLKTVNNIANELDISPCVAGDVFDYMNKAHQFSYRKILSKEECNTGCKNEAKRLNGLDENTINELINICESKCILDNIEITSNFQNESEFINLEKRAPCDPISQANVSLVKSNYNYGYNQYQDKGTKKTALSNVNGCGPKSKVMGIDADTIKKIPFLLDGTFEPACNMHDICYVCQKGKSTCDTRFKDGMMSICNKKYSTKKHPIKNAGCKVQAELFYKAVDLGGKNAYNGKPVNTGANCAACGVTVIKNTLVSTPFYVKK
ncbi:hypothetical protein PIROE2DRAFT_67844 [Piromyces sp. E2]|nr:hypothetical protein PIROE2DRAFT_67844 [Piromyces sp. E2]|eukprot:OUM57322.1 hypothetical protein PIROE2DRAFT_67844 [Piromyces sp. E2]